MIKGYILPIGSVVTLKKGNQALMIIGRAQLYNHNGEIGYFDYTSVRYPQGIISNSEFFFFNDEDIAEVVFEGYRSEQEIEFADSYEENIAGSKYEKLQVFASSNIAD